MKKSHDAFRTISEVSELLDTPAHVLRFWESKFSQIKPVKRAGGRRYYRPQDIQLIAGLKQLLHGDGLSIKEAQKLLREQGVKHVAGIGSDTTTEAAPAAVTPAPEPVVEAPVAEVAEPAKAAKKSTKKDPELNKRDETAAIGDLFGAFDPQSNVVPLHAPQQPVAPASAPTGSVSILTAIAHADAAKVANKSAKIAPLLARLSDVHARMLKD
jgi:DNA-binding transcriptional MerR regulator